MQRMRTLTSTLVLAVALLAPNASPPPAAGEPAEEAGAPGAAMVTAQREGASKEAPGATPSNTPLPSYIEADRAGVERALGAALTDQVFSDRFTPLRKQLIAASLRANPASGCARPPDFVLEIVAPVDASADASAWQERYLIKCNPDVRRTFLLVSTKADVKSAELAPGGTIADATLQQDVLQGVMTATIGRVPARCKDVRVRDTRVTSATALSQPWTEVWTLAACGKPIDVEVAFTPSPRGGTDWSVQLVK
jgi:hypothetical protein